MSRQTFRGEPCFTIDLHLTYVQGHSSQVYNMSCNPTLQHPKAFQLARRLQAFSRSSGNLQCPKCCCWERLGHVQLCKQVAHTARLPSIYTHPLSQREREKLYISSSHLGLSQHMKQQLYSCPTSSTQNNKAAQAV